MLLTEWACRRCGEAFFGCPPECGLCIACQEETGLSPALASAVMEVTADER